MADTGVIDLDSNFVGSRGRDLDFLDTQRFTSFPGNGGLALDGLLSSNSDEIVSFKFIIS